MLSHGLGPRVQVLAAALALLLSLPGSWATAATAPAAPAPAPSQPSAPAAPRASEAGAQVGGYYVQPAVDQLRRLGIITGDPDGRMRLHDTITRAELAKVAVAAMGEEAAAQRAMSGPPAFPDVKDHWARGYVAVARRLGITGGYEDGTFRPANPVTHAEAITMLLRAAGLKPAGPWPQAYLDAARGSGVLTEPLAQAVPPMQPATRGAVFLLAERSFTLVTDGSGRSLIQRVFAERGESGKIGIYAWGAESGSTTQAEVTLTISSPGAVMAAVNGRPAWPAGNVFAIKVPLQMGANELYIVTVDQHGTRLTERFTLTRR